MSLLQRLHRTQGSNAKKLSMSKEKSLQTVHITDVILRDAHQSLIATRMRTEDMLPACSLLDRIGYWSLECWGELHLMLVCVF